MGNLRPRGETNRARRTRLVEREALIGGTGTGDMLFGQEAIRTVADDFGKPA
jgi:hypothetical protein